mmetsp:Transcript_4666/g.5832  ORF Transcript_4666/g.5832 Transcript_4666/m.5832 type:complete len:152 (+) Transcript_4666:106-561(+)
MAKVKTFASYIVPRNFKLLDELENAEKGKYADATKFGEDCNWINLGLNGQDSTFTHWNATIIPHQGGHIGDRIYTLNIVAGPSYPNDPPLVKFVQKVALPCVNSKGQVDYTKLNNFHWNQDRCIFEILVAIRQMMLPYAQQCAQIHQGSTY